MNLACVAASYLPELHDQVHKRGGGTVSLLGRSHGGLQQILNRDLVSKSLIEQPLPGCQLAVGQDLNLQRERTASVHKTKLIKHHHNRHLASSSLGKKRIHLL